MMRNKRKAGAALFAAAVLCGLSAPCARAEDLEGKPKGDAYIAAVTEGNTYDNVYGNKGQYNSLNQVNGNVEMTGGTVGTIYGVYGNRDLYFLQGRVTLSGGKVTGAVYGVYNEASTYSKPSYSGITLSGIADVSQAELYGSNQSGTNGTLNVDNWSGTVGGLHNFNSITFDNVKLSASGEGTSISLLVAEGDNKISGISSGALSVGSLAAGDYAPADTPLRATIVWDRRLGDAITLDKRLINSSTEPVCVITDREEGGLYVNWFSDIAVETNTDGIGEGTNSATVSAKVTNSLLTGKFIDENVSESFASRPLVIGDGFTTNVGIVAGVYDLSHSVDSLGGVLTEGAKDGVMCIAGTPAEGFTKTIYAGYSQYGEVADNTVYVGWDGSTVKAAHAPGLSVEAKAPGSADIAGSNNALSVYGNGNTLAGISGFDIVSFDDVTLYTSEETGQAALSVTDADLTGASVSLNSLKGGTAYTAGDHVTLLQSANDMTVTDSTSVTYSDTVTAGVAQELQIETEQTATSIGMTVKSVSLASQTLTIAENRTAAAAFLNQGADIAADSLDLLGSDYQYGLRTFGAVYGSRSTWDAAGDLKINGWSEIVGLGNVHRKGDGDLSWGVFYENGTGNYRTWNEFNNEMFRGDGSLLYNGGGAAVRYQKDNGWYYEASLRAGTLSASMDNAVKDGKGNSYGFDSDSTYWGAHAGVGKVIETESGEWNVYGKYFHTDIDGDSFHIDGDRFEFDSLTSDRLRIGARYTADKAKRWSLYYGLAWEYEFSGDSHMKAGQWDAPEQSLGGNTGILEIGTVWQPDDSPWQANINLKGYAGEREGVSGMVQLAYTF